LRLTICARAWPGSWVRSDALRPTATRASGDVRERKPLSQIPLDRRESRSCRLDARSGLIVTCQEEPVNPLLYFFPSDLPRAAHAGEQIQYPWPLHYNRISVTPPPRRHEGSSPPRRHGSVKATSFGGAGRNH